MSSTAEKMDSDMDEQSCDNISTSGHHDAAGDSRLVCADLRASLATGRIHGAWYSETKST